MRVLFVVGRLQGAGTVFRLAERIAGDSRRIFFLFIQDGCRYSADPEVMRTLDFTENVYVLREDCRSLGLLDYLAEGVEAIDYGGWVGLLETCDRVVSWT